MANDLDRDREHFQVRPDQRMHVLLGVDGSRPSRRALAYAFGIGSPTVGAADSHSCLAAMDLLRRNGRPASGT
jgi:hypothetical protein